MGQRPARYGAAWSREELILAFDLYCRIPFKHTKHTNPQVRALAALLNRSPAAVARKLGNFGAFDPELAKRAVKGLTHGSKLDREVWEAFHSDWGRLISEADRIRREQRRTAAADTVGLQAPDGPSETWRTGKTRLHQAFFRQAVLSSYEGSCCITDLSVPEALVAAHIIPWSRNEENRANPRNGLCLSATFSCLFDAGFVGVTQQLRVCMSSRLLRKRDRHTRELITRYNEQPLRRPNRFAPEARFLQWHLDNVFCA